MAPSFATSFATISMLAASASAAFPDCKNGPLKNNTICDSSLPAKERVAGLLEVLTLEEKILNVNNEAPGSERLGLPEYNWWNEALHGVAASPGVEFADSGNFSSATSFPQPILIGAAFNDELVNSIAKVVSTEARAFSNGDRAGLDYWTPNINPFKDPRWGRGQETPGEDPFHLQQYVLQLLNGLQGVDEDSPYKKIVATCKHWAAYDLEGEGETSRHRFDAIVSDQDMSDYYSPPFKTCARDANVGSVMCAYNSVNGIPACANEFILQTLLREHWAWEADDHWITGDCEAVGDIFKEHKYVDNGPEGVALALKAGTDLDCGSDFAEQMPDAVDQGLVEEADLDKALSRLYTSLITVGYFDDPAEQPYRQIGWDDVNSAPAHELAYTAAVEGTVLVKNDGVLPLSSNLTVAVVGPLADASYQMQGNYMGIAPFLYSPIYGAEQQGYEVNHAKGTDIDSDDDSGFDEAIEAAENSDVIVFVGGIDNGIESESHDRTSISWPGNQLDLVAELQATGKPVIVIQIGGGQVDSSTLLNGDSAVNALIWGGYPGQAGGLAIFDIISGKKSPAGRMPITQYPEAYVDEVPITDMTLRPSDDNPGRTYKWYSGKPVVEFGHGLHYTNFTLGWTEEPTETEFDIQALVEPTPDSPPAPQSKAEGDPLDLIEFKTFEVNVSNEGDVSSDFVVLAFVKTANAGPEPYPNKSLVSYTRLHGVGAGFAQTASLKVTLGALARADEAGDLVLYPGDYTLVLDVPEQLTFEFTLTGEAAVLDEWPKEEEK
ncbi:hypothetical protein FQN54_000764 [Arachnomyces sp. PD_36]|nr:hypothetical protein FQN54_000764 [Arachnomyces sp. PD_36]